MGPIIETAVYYPSIILTASGGGSVAYTSGAASGVVKEGTNLTLYMPFGGNLSLTATPSSVLQAFQTWSGDLSSKTARTSLAVHGPASVTAEFGVNFVGIAESVVVAAAIAAVVGIMLIRRKNRPRVARGTANKKEGWT